MIKYSNAYDTPSKIINKNKHWGYYVKIYKNREVSFEKYLLDIFKLVGYMYK